MASRRLSKRRPIKLDESLYRRLRRWKGRNLLNASVPMAIEAFCGRRYFNTWFRMKLALGGRRVRK